MARIDELFRYLKDQEGSDLHLLAGLVPRIRKDGSLEPVAGWTPLSHEELTQLLREACPPDLWEAFESNADLDFAYGLEGVARFRCNYLQQEQGAGAVFRLIPERILSTDELGVPEPICRLADLERGLVLVTGPTGSGKSTTLAAIIDRINRTHSKHILTIEDPVEFVHPNLESVFTQREVGHDTDSFGGALRAAIRQDADVILVGEMRDLETIALAITAAEMGSLVFGTLHTNGAINTVDRLIDAFPAEQQSQVRTSLADSLAAVVSQQLLPRAGGKGRVAAHEVLLRTQGLPNIIREGNTQMMRSVIQAGRKEGMQAMDDALQRLLDEGVITADAARAKASDKSRFAKAET